MLYTAKHITFTTCIIYAILYISVRTKIYTYKIKYYGGGPWGSQGGDPCGSPKMPFGVGFIKVLGKICSKNWSARGLGLRGNLCGGRPGRDPCGASKMQFEAGFIRVLGKKGSQKGVRRRAGRGGARPAIQFHGRGPSTFYLYVQKKTSHMRP